MKGLFTFLFAAELVNEEMLPFRNQSYLLEISFAGNRVKKPHLPFR